MNILEYNDMVYVIYLLFNNKRELTRTRLINKEIGYIATSILFKYHYVGEKLIKNYYNINIRKIIIIDKINIPISATCLTFGFFYNQITNIPNSVTHLTFGCCYNQITNIPNSVTHLTFGGNYNQIINIPKSVTHLTFGGGYNLITNIPKSITILLKKFKRV